MARLRDERRIASLRQAAAAVVDDLPIYDNGRRIAIGLGVVGALLAVGAIGFGVSAAMGGGLVGMDSVERGVLAGTLLFVAVFVGGLGLMRLRKSRGPFLVVNAAGFRCMGVADPVAWSDVDAVQVFVGKTFTTVFHLAEGVALPVKTGWPLSVRLVRKKRLLMLRGFVPKGMKPQAYLDLLTRALHAHRAKALLQMREAEGATW